MSGLTEIQQHLAAEAKLKAEIAKKDRVIERLKLLYLDAYGVVLGCGCNSCAEKIEDAESEIKEAGCRR